jgi:beta-N-acetylhexosaminidase
MNGAVLDGELRRAAAGTLLSSFAGPVVPDWVVDQVDGGLGGVCLYGSNRGADVAAVAARLHARRADVVVALDEEGGDVTRLEAATGSSVPGNAALGAVDDVELTRSLAAALGRVLRSVGVDLDLAPCADVNSDPTNPVIGVRSFGADADLVARHTAATVGGLQAAGVAACAKHFPGHGAVAVDSHVALPTVSAPLDVLAARELVPFRAAVAAGVAAVMPGHLLVPALDDVPATISRRIVTDVLRGELAFGGLVVTDALDMGGIGGPAAIPANVVRALAAGADLCCLGPDNDRALVEACLDAVVAAVAGGELAAHRVVEAADRVAALRSRTAVAAAVRVPASERAAHAVGGAPVLPHEPSPGDALAALGADAARRSLRIDGVLPRPRRGAHVVELDRPANIAAGTVPWGVAGALAELDPTITTTRIAEGDDHAVAGALLAARDRPLAVVVRDPQRRPLQADALADLLAARPDAVVVDMGWPGSLDTGPGAASSGAARITTYGASAASGRAVARLLWGGDESAPTPPPETSTTPGRTSRG